MLLTLLSLLHEINLSSGLLLVFAICLIAVLGFEFVNGFHDTANAVATVIYTHALKPKVAVIWSGVWNFIGVFSGGVAVAMGILKLVPLNELIALPVYIGACLVLAVLISSIIWNVGTWYFGIPCSSSHTLIGSMIGASLGFTLYYGGSGVNWGKAEEIGLSLIMSPLFGFGAAILLMYFLSHVIKAKQLFHIPQGQDKPPLLIRGLLILTCTLVSFFHGSNDGQKGVGLLMLILMVFVPAHFALNHEISDEKIMKALTTTEQTVHKMIADGHQEKSVLSLDTLVTKTKSEIALKDSKKASDVFLFRKHVQTINKDIKALVTGHEVNLSESDRKELKESSASLSKVTDYAPVWVIAAISIALGLGTMIGWKRIVLTIGEKIGKEHLNYAQGATAEIVAATTIGLSTGLGLPVSTTHVLSSGIAGAMVASKGAGNLNKGTLRSIALAWVLTLPVCITLSFLLFVILHLFV
jgi:PiT family inorganic phosphate transporter